MFDFVSRYSDLELLVRLDMVESGYDPDNGYDIEMYWETKLS